MSVCKDNLTPNSIKIAIIGSKGIMGQRYCKILNRAGIEVLEYDLKISKDINLRASGAVGAIICTPTDTHLVYIEQLCELQVPFLCEKPVCLSVGDTERAWEFVQQAGVNAHVVSNWRYTRHGFMGWDTGSHEINYKHFHSGNDGLLWDCCQLVYLAKDHRPTLSSEADQFSCTIDGEEISLLDIEESYSLMLMDWLRQFCGKHVSDNMWDFDDAVSMALAVQKRIKEEFAEASKETSTETSESFTRSKSILS